MAQLKLERRFRRVVVHGCRVAMFTAVVVLVNVQTRVSHTRSDDQSTSNVTLELVQTFFPTATQLSDPKFTELGEIVVFDENGDQLGGVVETSPMADDIIGFSGPTNAVVMFDIHHRIAGVHILSSRDTRDHVQAVRDDSDFIKSFHGTTIHSAARSKILDAVSGATLTSLAIRESIARRFGGTARSLKFPDPLALSDVSVLFNEATRIVQDPELLSLWRVFGAAGELGTVLRSSPYADNLVGYQGPTEVLIGINQDDRVTGIAIGHSFDNEPYVGYVQEDDYFLSVFNDQSVSSLASLDLDSHGVEGVSGATMSSMAAAAAVQRSAKQFGAERRLSSLPKPSRFKVRDVGTGLVLVCGLTIGFTRLRGYRSLRLAFQFCVVGYLGLMNGDMVSQAVLFGWAENGIPWRNATGLCLLVGGSLLVPIVSRHNVYCSHLCPHGALQQMIKNRLPWQWRLSLRVQTWAKMIPVMLLLWCIVVSILGLGYSLVDIEPFDAWLFKVAGAATLTIAVLGLVFSLFVPMGYCRFGCPTGSVLSYLRFQSRSDHWGRRDWAALSIVTAAFLMLWW